MNDPTVVAEYSNHAQAELASNMLGSFGISCEIWADDCGGMAPGQSFVSGVKIYVDSIDYEKAREIMKHLKSS